MTRGGEPYWSDQRAYFVARHDGVVPGGFKDHGNINHHQLDLGSWDGKRPVLCARAAMNRAPVAVSPKLRTVTPEMERQARARASGCASIVNEDMRNFCIFMSSSVGASCGGIKNADMRNVCIGIGKSIAADCGKVRDKELRTSCGEIRSHRQYESEGEKGGWFW